MDRWCPSKPTRSACTPTRLTPSISHGSSGRNSNRPGSVWPRCAMRSGELAHMTVLKPGWLTTVQDLGRYGYQQYGVPVSGAMDRRAFIIANRLVGNRDHDAGLEMTLKGPELLFEQSSVIAVTG